MAPRDPFRYFRVEARELLDGLNQGVLELERGGAPGEAIKRLLRLAHTLKGASRVVRLPELADLAHRVEEVLQSPSADSGIPVAGLAALSGFLRAIAQGLDGLDAPEGAPPDSVPKAAPEAPLDNTAAREAPRPDTVRLEIAELDSVLNGLREAGGRLAALKSQTSGLKRARRLARDLAVEGPAEGRAGAHELNAWLEGFDRRALATLDQAERDLAQAHDKAARLRLLPATLLFDFLERVARDAARVLDRQIRFVSEGADQRLDAAVLAALQDALQHVVRNAVVHGLEDAAGRRAAGKDVRGLVRIRLIRRGENLFLACSDDGRGIRHDEVRRVAVSRGLLSKAQAEALDEQAAVALLLKGGISTAKSVSELSGRGVGLDAARAVVERMRGRLDIRSTPGQGTEVELQVPGSLVSFETLAVEAGGRQALIPFQSVRRALRLDPKDIARSPEGDTVLLPQGGLPYLALRPLLAASETESGRLPGAGVVVWSGAGEAVLGVDRIVGIRESVVQPMPELSPRPRFASGASLDAAGAACVVLDPEGLVEEARLMRGSPAPGSLAAAPRILVVDDSLTTRMLEQSILETAGYRVELASSGEEGLAKARQERFGLILVDVEMPGMNGFEFLESLAADPALRATPAILVTSRNAPEDRRRGEAAGARDYIVKGEFDQARLLGRIRELTA
ncbi:MAG TPA: response regulator [bacterium]|jgi:two-component system chemotaxis sensor kinase CheA|nr:response regulator [bacterium]